MKRVKKVFDRAFLLYCLVGVLNYVVCTVLMFLLYNLGLCGMLVSSLVNYVLGSVIWYWACFKFIFPGQKQTPGLLIRFVLEVLLCYLVSYHILAPMVVQLLSEEIAALLASLPAEQAKTNFVMAIGSLVYAILNYFGQRYLVFHTFHAKRRKLRQGQIQ